MPPMEVSSPAYDSDARNADEIHDDFIPLEPLRFANGEEEVDYEGSTGYGSGQNVERRMIQGSGRRHMIGTRRLVAPKSRGVPNGFHVSQNSQAPKLGGLQKHAVNRDPRAASIVNGNKVWSWKPKPENDSRISQTKVLQEDINESDQNKNHEVLIGSISVTLSNCNQQEDKTPAEAPYDYPAEYPIMKKGNAQEKLKPDTAAQTGTNRSTIKCWRPVSRHGSKGFTPVQMGCRESEADVITGQAGDQTLSNESCLRSSTMNGNSDDQTNNDGFRSGSIHFNIHAAKAFLSESKFNLQYHLDYQAFLTLFLLGWKEAIASEHVKLLLSPEAQSDYHHVTQSSDQQKQNARSITDNNIINNRSISNGGVLESSNGVVKAKFRMKTADKGTKIKYIPKQKITT